MLYCAESDRLRCSTVVYTSIADMNSHGEFRGVPYCRELEERKSQSMRRIMLLI